MNGLERLRGCKLEETKDRRVKRNVGSWLGAWNIKRTLVFLAQGTARDVDPSASARKGLGLAPLTTMLYKY